MHPDTAQGHRTFLVLLKASSLVVDRLDRRLQERVGIQLTWYEVLMQLRAAPEGRISLRQLGDGVMLSKSGVSRLIDRMERADMVRRHDCPNDGRVCFAAITPRGRAAYEVARPVACDAVSEYFASHLTTDEAETMTQALLRVLDRAGRDCVPATDLELADL